MKPEILLVTTAIDFGETEWFVNSWDRIVRSMVLGKGGDVSHGCVPGAGMAWREAKPLPAGRTPKARRTAVRVQPDGSCILLAGRLFRTEQLLERFKLPPSSDPADIYAAAYARLGDDCDKAIVGDYSVVQWFPGKRMLRLTRSPTSSMPLHVWRQGARLIVSSLPGPILASGVPSRINDEHLADMMLLNLRDGTSSWYAGMHRVACGSCEVHDPAGMRRTRYWSINDVPDVRLRRDADYVEALDSLFEEAVREAIGGASAPAILLSGGLDSQAVASYAVGNLGTGKCLRSFTSVPMAGHVAPNRPFVFGDESAHVRALCAMYPQIEPDFLDSADYSFGDRQARHMLVGGWPTVNEMNAHWVHAALERAADAGCDAMLTGDYGNASFSYDGLTGYPTWLRSGQWTRLLHEVGKSADKRPYWRKLLSLAVMPHVPLSWRRKIDRSRSWRPSPFSVWCPIREDFARTAGALSRADAAGADIDFYDVASSRQWRKGVVDGLGSVCPEINLGFRLLYGLPMRDPTAYLPLLEFCAGLPDEQYLRNGQTRWLARRLLKDRVPEMVWGETRTGAQSQDWPVRFKRDRESLLAEMASIKNDPRLADVFDLDRMITTLSEWDGTDTPQARDNLRINAAIGRGVSTARFVSFVEGRNVG